MLLSRLLCTVCLRNLSFSLDTDQCRTRSRERQLQHGDRAFPFQTARVIRHIVRIVRALTAARARDRMGWRRALDILLYKVWLRMGIVWPSPSSKNSISRSWQSSVDRTTFSANSLSGENSAFESLLPRRRKTQASANTRPPHILYCTEMLCKTTSKPTTSLTTAVANSSASFDQFMLRV